MSTIMMCLLLSMATPQTDMLDAMARVATQMRVRSIRDHRIIVESDQ